MMKRLLAVLLVMVMGVTPLALAGNLASPMENAVIGTEIWAKGLPLQDFLNQLREQAGIELAAVPEVSSLKVDMLVAAGETLEQVLAELGRKYGLIGKVNEAGTAVIVFQGTQRQEMMFAGRAILSAGIPGPGGARDVKISPQMQPPGPYRPIQWNTEEYKNHNDNNFQDALSTPLSTFSIDVDTASYSNVRRFLNTGNLPPVDAVRTEEMLNYFPYDYPQPTNGHPFSVTAEIGDCPWNPGRKLVLLGLQGQQIKTEHMPPTNLVFLIDVSGSMAEPNKLPLLKTAFKLLVRQMRPQDNVAIVVYAGAAGLVLEPTSGSEKAKIIDKIDSLQAGGSTAGSEGLKLAYKVAREKFNGEGNNRVILATDGDFNVGPSSEGELTRMIEEYRKDGISLSVLGFGMGNVKDNKMEMLADKGNGNYAYIDNALEARKVMVSQMAGTLYTIAKDVKLQVEFNPAQVKSYRLVGYEKRVMDDRDFNDDRKDAGDMGAGHSMTALYEIIPAGSSENEAGVDPLTFQQRQVVPSEDLLQVKIRYKKPKDETSILMITRVSSKEQSAAASENFRLAASVAEYAMLLRNSEFKGLSSYQQALALARGARGNDTEGYRSEFIKLMEISRLLDPKQ